MAWINRSTGSRITDEFYNKLSVNEKKKYNKMKYDSYFSSYRSTYSSNSSLDIITGIDILQVFDNNSSSSSYYNDSSSSDSSGFDGGFGGGDYSGGGSSGDW